MKLPPQLHTLGQVVSLRAREQERLSQELASQQVRRERFHQNLHRLEQLCEQSGASGTLPIALSANCANYKQAVMHLAHTHREQLVQHEREMATTRTSLVAAARRHEAMDQLMQNRLQVWQAERAVQAQKQQDEVAAQAWGRAQP
jgi:flagellar export protein FliJ